MIIDSTLVPKRDNLITLKINRIEQKRQNLYYLIVIDWYAVL